MKLYLKVTNVEKSGLCRGKSRMLWIKSGQIAAYQFLQQLIPVQLADHAAGIVVIGDIGGIFRQQIADDLVHGVVAFFLQRVEHSPENAAHILFVIAGNGEFQGAVIRHGIDLLVTILVL